MKKNDRQIIRLICVGILFVAAFVVLVHKGAIPKSWEQTAEVMPSSLGHSASQIIQPERKWQRKRMPSVTTTPPMMPGRLEPNIAARPITV